MKSMNDTAGTPKKGRSGKAGKIRTLDAFIVICILLIAISAIGQDVAVYAINRRNSSQNYEMTFVLRSAEKEGAAETAALQSESEEGLTVTSSGKKLGTVWGALTLLNEDSEGDYTDVGGVLRFTGRTKNQKVYLFEFGLVEEGDVLAVELNGHSYALSISGIKESEMEKS